MVLSFRQYIIEKASTNPVVTAAQADIDRLSKEVEAKKKLIADLQKQALALQDQLNAKQKDTLTSTGQLVNPSAAISKPTV